MIATANETAALAFHSPVGLAGAACGAGQAAAGPGDVNHAEVSAT